MIGNSRSKYLRFEREFGIITEVKETVMPKYYVGEEKFCTDNAPEEFSVRDFWHFAFGDLLDNTRRGSLAEFIVARALGLSTEIPRADWSAYDLDYHGKEIEVKASAYLQSWNLKNGKISKPVFSIAPARMFDETAGKYQGDCCRHSDYYIFCLFQDIDAETYNILDLSHWKFFAVPTAEIDRLFLRRKSITLGKLEKIAEGTDYCNLKSVLDGLIAKDK